jgi:hypothetical protein
MKRAGNIMMILLLLISTGGISITRHYCGESVISVSMFSTPKSCCGSGCEHCRNENIFNKVTDDFTVTTIDAQFSVVTGNPVHGNFIIDLISPLPVSTMAVSMNPRKFLYRKTGDFPVSFGNFRC